MYYRKKPVIIEAVAVSTLLSAIQLKEADLPQWVRDHIASGHLVFTTDQVVVKTDTGRAAGGKTDMLIKGSLGEVYPCPADVFAVNYEEALPTGDTAAPSSFADNWAADQGAAITPVPPSPAATNPATIPSAPPPVIDAPVVPTETIAPIETPAVASDFPVVETPATPAVASDFPVVETPATPPVETVHYADGSSATGIPPLPLLSPDEQAVAEAQKPIPLTE